MATIVAIEDEAAAPFADALREARDVIDELVDGASPLPQLAERARQLDDRLARLLDPGTQVGKRR